MKLTGSYEINLDKQSVWESLNDPNILKKSIPGCEEFKKNSETTFTATATNKIGPFNASFTGEIELKNLNPPNSYKIVGEGNSPVGFASGEADVQLNEKDGVTTLSYSIQANVGGKIAQVGSRLIDMTAKKMADIFFGKFSEVIVTQKEKNISKDSTKDNQSEKDLKGKPLNNRTYFYISIVVIIAIISIYMLNS